MQYKKQLMQFFFAAVFTLASFAFNSPARADKHTDLTTPTGWVILIGVDTAAVNAQIAAGFRLIDLDVVGAAPLKLDATFVANSGAYTTGWWWYVGVTSQDLVTAAIANNARIVDLCAYVDGGVVRYAAIMIPNTGTEAVHWFIQSGYTAAQVGAWCDKDGPFAPFGRIYDIAPYSTSGGTRYAFIGVPNVSLSDPGIQWNMQLGDTRDAILATATEGGYRITDMERHSDGLWSAVMVARGGMDGSVFTEIPSSEIGNVVVQDAGRIVDIVRTSWVGNGTFTLVTRQNENAATLKVNRAMRDQLQNPYTESGILLHELDGAESVSLNEEMIFEPASTLKTAHAFAAMWRVALGNNTLSERVAVPTGSSGSCPTVGSPTTPMSLSMALSLMLGNSDNQATEGIRAHFGTSTIENLSAAVGATSVGLNHTLGCGGPVPNTLTLRDLGKIHTAARSGLLGTYESTFNSYFLHGTNLGSVNYKIEQALAAELATSGLSSAQQSEFRSHVYTAAKGGSYGIAPLPYTYHYSWGVYAKIPFRVGCAIVDREFFLGCFINNHQVEPQINDALGMGLRELSRVVIRDALASWRSAECGDQLDCGNYLVAGAGGAESSFSISSSIELESITLNTLFNNYDNDQSWAADLLVGIIAPNGATVEFGGYNTTFGYPDAGASPTAWNSALDGDYGWYTMNTAAFGLGGTGAWTVRVKNGWLASAGASWTGEICLRGVPVTPGDIDLNGIVDAADLAMLLGGWGACGGSCAADFNGDGTVGAADLAILLNNWT